jgi:hypothetical protein
LLKFVDIVPNQFIGFPSRAKRNLVSYHDRERGNRETRCPAGITGTSQNWRYGTIVVSTEKLPPPLTTVVTEEKSLSGHQWNRNQRDVHADARHAALLEPYARRVAQEWK